MEEYYFNRDGTGFQLEQENDRIEDDYFKMEAMKDPTDPLVKYAMKIQGWMYDNISGNMYKQALWNKHDMIMNQISKSMSSSIPSYSFDQVFMTKQGTSTLVGEAYVSDYPELQQLMRLDQTFMNIDTDYTTIGL
jgi:hypothetical protein